MERIEIGFGIFSGLLLATSLVIAWFYRSRKLFVHLGDPEDDQEAQLDREKIRMLLRHYKILFRLMILFGSTGFLVLLLTAIISFYAAGSNSLDQVLGLLAGAGNLGIFRYFLDAWKQASANVLGCGLHKKDG